MEMLFYLEGYRHFLGAAERARELAMQHQKQTGVRRHRDGWEVLVPRMVLRAERCDSESEIDDEESVEFASGDDSESEARELSAELAGDGEDFARSEEEGWFYSDEYESGLAQHDSQYGRFQAQRDSSGRTIPSGSGC